MLNDLNMLSLPSDCENAEPNAQPDIIEVDKPILDELFTVIEKVRRLAKLARKGIISHYVINRIKAEGFADMTNFILDFHVRWNSTYLMLVRVQKLKNIATCYLSLITY